MSTLLADIEQAILDRLKAKVQGVAVNPYPERPAEYTLMHPVGEVLLCYARSEFTPPLPTDIVVQDQTIVWTASVIMRGLRPRRDGQHVSYTALQAVRGALTGYSAPGCTKLYPLKEALVSEDGGIWRYDQEWSHKIRQSELDRVRPKIEYDSVTGYADDALYPG